MSCSKDRMCLLSRAALVRSGDKPLVGKRSFLNPSVPADLKWDGVGNTRLVLRGAHGHDSSRWRGVSSGGDNVKYAKAEGC